MAKRTIKLFEGVKVVYDGEETIVKSPAELWEMFNWDIKNDPEADAAASEVTRQLIGWGYIDMTPAMPNGHTLTVEIIPVKETSNEEKKPLQRN